MNSYKLKMIVAAVTGALTAPVYAFIPTVNAPQLEVFISGASAPSNAMREHAVNNYCDVNQPIDVFVDVVNVVPTPTVIMEHNKQWAVACISAAGQAAAGQRVLIRKSDDGGSGRGVVPVDEPTLASSPQKFQDLSGTHCPVAGVTVASAAGPANYTYHDCDGVTVNQAPDAGTSDIEPNKFIGSLAPVGTSFKAVSITSATTFPGPGLAFGIGVTLALRNELQADQIASGHIPFPALASGEAPCTPGDERVNCMPSLSAAYVAAIFTGKIKNWADFPVLDGRAPNVPAAFVGANKNRVHICRRVQGSGTHAQHAIHYLRTNCQAGTPPFLAQPGGGIAQNPFVFENSGAGDVGNCLHALDTGTGYGAGLPAGTITPVLAAGVQSFGIGYLSLERNVALGENWRYVKNSQIPPRLNLAYDGAFNQMYYLSFQYRDSSKPNGLYINGPGRLLPITGGNQAVLTAAGNTAFRDAFAGIDGNILRLLNGGFNHTFGQSGYLATAALGNIPAAFNPNGPHHTPWQRVVGTSPDSCQALSRK